MAHLVPYEYRAHVTRIVDGDTVDLVVDLGFTVHMDLRVRIAGIDTPEIYGVKHTSEEYAAGKEASEYLKGIMPPGSPVMIRTEQDTGKYGRWIADIFLDDGTDIGEAMVAAGHAERIDR